MVAGERSLAGHNRTFDSDAKMVDNPQNVFYRYGSALDRQAMNTPRKTISPIYFAGLLIGVACLAWSTESYDQNILTAPRFPDVRSGKIISYNNHGTTVYLTKKQVLMERWGPWGWLAYWIGAH